MRWRRRKLASPHMALEASEDILPAVFRYRQVLTWASAISFVSILLTFWAWFRINGIRVLEVLVLLPLLLPYAFIPLRLYSQRLRSGLNLAIAMGGALFVPGIMLVRFALTWDRRWWVLGSLILALLMQLVLNVLAVKTYIPLPRLRHARLNLLISMAYGFLLFGLFCLFYSPVPVRITASESAATKYLEDQQVPPSWTRGHTEAYMQKPLVARDRTRIRNAQCLPTQ